MLRESIRGLDLSHITNIIITVLAEHIINYGVKLDIIQDQFKDLNKPIYWNIIKESKSQVDTIRKSLSHKIKSFIIKDCDNSFTVDIGSEDDIEIAIFNLNECSHINPSNKTYIEHNNFSVNNIIDKFVLSPFFCCGAYYFASSESFLKISQNKNKLSEVIQNYIDNGKTVTSIHVDNYIDWGTLEDWNNYKNQYRTFFCDIDGVLIENAGEYLTPSWGNQPSIKANVDLLRKLYDEGKTEIILTTARKEHNRKLTEEELKKHNIPYHQLICLKYGSKRIIINDYAKTNKFPTCEAVNIPRNYNKLEELI